MSYASHDREVAHRLVATLREKLPPTIQVDADADVVLPGDDIFVRIAKTLSQVDALIVIISKGSSSSNWVRSEVAWALAQRDGKLPIFPLLIGSPDAIPHLLKTRVYIDFSDEKRFDEKVTDLAEAIIQKLVTKPGLDCTEYTAAKDLEYEYLESQKSTIDYLKQEYSAMQRTEERQLKLYMSIVILISIASVLLAGGILELSDHAQNWIIILLPPVLLFFGTTFGFYFGQQSSFYFRQQSSFDLEGDRQKERNREHQAS